MPVTAKKKATYEDLYQIPENMIGEIIHGELIASARPAPKHAVSVSVLGAKICGAFHLGDVGGPGGGWILFEPELSLGEHILVPDLAGWRRERLPSMPEENWFSVPPDWVCEVLSPGTAMIDRVRKLPIYAEHGVAYVWLVDPRVRTLEIFQLDSGRWMLVESHVESGKVRAVPFQEIEIDLAQLWA
ncbi:MAG: Uma2 family endonuclease [Deltaproteobacteria bacterium]|nr:Uma2 family endonuclease [Deltaproteobacteria bacterium]